MKKIIYKQNSGFTIIETMVAISLFLVIVMTGMGTLLNANLLHAKSQNMRSIIDNLSFIMEDMSRNLRTGYDYHCVDQNTSVSDFSTVDPTPLSCADGWAISFKTSVGTQWIYYFDYNNHTIQKSVDGGVTFVQLTPPEVKIDTVSGFSILGAEPPPNDTQQPFVRIRLVGTITSQGITTPVSMDTSVSQRLVDTQK